MFLSENISRQEGRQEDALEFRVLNLIVDHFESLVENFLFGELSVIQGGNNVDQEQVSNLVGHHLSDWEWLDNDLAVLGVQDGEEGTSYGETVSWGQETGDFLFDSLGEGLHLQELSLVSFLAAHEISNNRLHDTESRQTLIHQLLHDSVQLVENAFSQLRLHVTEYSEIDREAILTSGLLHEKEIVSVEA